MELSDEPVITGEEDEKNIEQWRSKLYELVAVNGKKEWKERLVYKSVPVI